MSTLSKVYSSREEINTDILRCWLEINLSNLKNNIQSFRNIITDKMDIICVTKANAYGFGTVTISNYLESIGIKYFAVSTLQEAIDLRTKGNIKGEIIILTWTPPSQKDLIIKYNLIQTLVDYNYAQKLNETTGVVKCHIKVDTGLNRFGHKVTEIDIFKKMFELKNLNILGIFSHLCRECEFTDEANEFSKKQIENFDTVITQLEKAGLNVGMKHMMDSIGTLRFNDTKYDMVRPGLVLYGMPANINSEPIKELLRKNNFKPLGALKCRVMAVKTIEKGEKVGYGSKFIAPEKTKLATIGIGFVDGFPCACGGNNFNVIIKGNKCPITGSVCMDATMVKVPMDCDVKAGDIATIFGFDEKGDLLNYQEFFSKTGLSVEETISRFGERITRVYHL